MHFYLSISIFYHFKSTTCQKESLHFLLHYIYVTKIDRSYFKNQAFTLTKNKQHEYKCISPYIWQVYEYESL